MESEIHIPDYAERYNIKRESCISVSLSERKNIKKDLDGFVKVSLISFLQISQNSFFPLFF